jgi:glycosyltransferase involved in cell wall biosynthesis
MLKALNALYPDTLIEFFSHGKAYRRYDHAFQDHAINIPLVGETASRSWRNKRNIQFLPSPVRALAKKALTRFTKWHFDIPEILLEGIDVLWVPWLHWHRIPKDGSQKVVGSLHDTILFNYETGLPPTRVSNEEVTIGKWIDSKAQIVVSSHATSRSLKDQFGAHTSRFHIVPLSGDHVAVGEQGGRVPDWEWLKDDYLLYAANISPHKNHERLLEAYSAWQSKKRLVLTGEGADLQKNERGAALYQYAKALGIRIGETLTPIGYLTAFHYDYVLKHAWGLVMCSLAEGGGSFPVWEALLNGIPVICADIPVMREHMDRVGGEVIWFDPYDPGNLVDKLKYLDANYGSIKQEVQDLIPRLKQRSWKNVAEDYYQIFMSIAGKG